MKPKDATWLQVRMTSREKERIETVAAAYGVTLSMMVRLMTSYFAENLPTVAMTTYHQSKKAGA